VKLQGQGLKASSLADAAQRVVAATETVAARVVAVDATDERAAAFYEHFGFARTAPGSSRLVQAERTARRATQWLLWLLRLW
jgi:ribosomal protein S18 acetylase RimI-like enzyme